MGLDVSLTTDNYKEIGRLADNLYYQHRLSRTFCWFLGREDVVEHEPELDQIGRVTNTDIQMIYDMSYYQSWKESIEFELEFAESEEEKQRLSKSIKELEELSVKLKNNWFSENFCGSRRWGHRQRQKK